MVGKYSVKNNQTSEEYMIVMNKESVNLNQITQKTKERDILFSQLFQQTHTLHTLNVDNLNAVRQFFPQNSSELSDYVQKAQNEAQ